MGRKTTTVRLTGWGAETNNSPSILERIFLPLTSLLQGRFTTKSDVWSFGVTLWEVLTLARHQPFESLSDEEVLANISNLASSLSSQLLQSPGYCPKEIRDLMTECWQREERERPSFREIHLFLQRKNLGFDPDKDL